MVSLLFVSPCLDEPVNLARIAILAGCRGISHSRREICELGTGSLGFIGLTSPELTSQASTAEQIRV